MSNVLKIDLHSTTTGVGVIKMYSYYFISIFYHIKTKKRIIDYNTWNI